MTVHIGQITSEVRNTAPPAPPAASDGTATSSGWDEEARLSALLARLTLDRMRTATGPDR